MIEQIEAFAASAADLHKSVCGLDDILQRWNAEEEARSAELRRTIGEAIVELSIASARLRDETRFIPVETVDAIIAEVDNLGGVHA